MKGLKLEPVFSSRNTDKKEQEGLTRSKRLVMDLARLLGFAPPQKLNSLDPEKIKALKKENEAQVEQSHDNSWNNIFNLISDIGSSLGMLLAFDFSYTPTASPEEPKATPAPSPAPAKAKTKTPAPAPAPTRSKTADPAPVFDRTSVLGLNKKGNNSSLFFRPAPTPVPAQLKLLELQRIRKLEAETMEAQKKASRLPTPLSIVPKPWPMR